MSIVDKLVERVQEGLCPATNDYDFGRNYGIDMACNIIRDYFNSEQKQDESLQIDVYTHDDSFSIQNVTEYDFGADDKMFRVHTQHRIWFFPYDSIDHIEYIYVDRLHKLHKERGNE